MNWFTFVAQILNFLILIWLLKRFLFSPIVEAMDEREARINSRLEEAREQREEATQEAEAYRAKQKQLEEEREAYLAEAEEEAEERRRELIAEARAEVKYLEEEWRESLRRDRESFLKTLSERSVEEAVAIARRALQDLADAELEEQSFEIFLERLRSLDEDRWHDLAEALREAEGEATVRSAFGLSSEQQERIRTVIAEQADEEVVLSAEEDPSLGVGVELRVEDKKVAWTLESYLTQLVENVRGLLETELKDEWAASAGEMVSEPSSTNEA